MYLDSSLKHDQWVLTLLDYDLKMNTYLNVSSPLCKWDDFFLSKLFSRHAGCLQIFSRARAPKVT